MIKPFVKWPGGKTGELEIIHRYLPSAIHHYIEPFLGGGACFFSLPEDRYAKAFLNDFSNELILLYQFIQSKNHQFLQYVRNIWEGWEFFGRFSDVHYRSLRKLYERYKKEEIGKEQLATEIELFIEAYQQEIISSLPLSVRKEPSLLLSELKKSIISKFSNMKRNEQKKGNLPEDDYRKNIEASLRASVYSYFRFLYNQRDVFSITNEMHIALFFFLREFCYSSMFRYNKKGEFNVPYGGASYNRKAFDHKIDFLLQSDLQRRLKNANLFNDDFEVFLQAIDLSKDDFIFIDPPYDSDFSTYANHSFSSEDQQRLANYLLTKCPCKFMVVIKNTDFIYQLYNKQGIRLIGFSKSYSVSFMDRNDRKVEHLLITNY